MKLSGWKTITGGSIAVPALMLPKLAEQFLNIDTSGWEQYFNIAVMIGSSLWGVGVADKSIRKVLPYTRKLEKLLEWFNAWAGKRGQGGGASLEVVKQVPSLALAAIMTTALVNDNIKDAAVVQERLDDAKQITIVGDSATTVTAKRDTSGAVMRRDTVTTPYDKAREKNNFDGYANGFQQHVFTHEIIDLLTGKDTVVEITSLIPKIGTNVVNVIRAGKAEHASEMVPDICETLGDSLAGVLGWYPVMDTTVWLDKDGKESKRETAKRWAQSIETVTKIIEYVEPKDEPIGEVIP